MEFKMFVGNNLIDSVPVSITQIRKQGFMEGLIAMLCEKHIHLLETSVENPCYYIDHVPSAMNDRRKNNDSIQ